MCVIRGESMVVHGGWGCPAKHGDELVAFTLDLDKNQSRNIEQKLLEAHLKECDIEKETFKVIRSKPLPPQVAP